MNGAWIYPASHRAIGSASGFSRGKGGKLVPAKTQEMKKQLRFDENTHALTTAIFNHVRDLCWVAVNGLSRARLRHAHEDAHEGIGKVMAMPMRLSRHSLLLLCEASIIIDHD